MKGEREEMGNKRIGRGGSEDEERGKGRRTERGKGKRREG